MTGDEMMSIDKHYSLLTRISVSVSKNVYYTEIIKNKQTPTNMYLSTKSNR